ncbi:MAG: hypothetical protein H6546_02875 [Chitinophagales bacterium]|nr:hypothetical protein [Chitinophagales bacterium]
MTKKTDIYSVITSVEKFLEDNPGASLSLVAIDQDGTFFVKKTTYTSKIASLLATRTELAWFIEHIRNLNAVVWSMKSQKVIN